MCGVRDQIIWLLLMFPHCYRLFFLNLRENCIQCRATLHGTLGISRKVRYLCLRSLKRRRKAKKKKQIGAGKVINRVYNWIQLKISHGLMCVTVWDQCYSLTLAFQPGLLIPLPTIFRHLHGKNTTLSRNFPNIKYKYVVQALFFKQIIIIIIIIIIIGKRQSCRHP